MQDLVDLSAAATEDVQPMVEMLASQTDHVLASLKVNDISCLNKQTKYAPQNSVALMNPHKCMLRCVLAKDQSFSSDKNRKNGYPHKSTLCCISALCSFKIKVSLSDKNGNKWQSGPLNKGLCLGCVTLAIGKVQ